MQNKIAHAQMTDRAAGFCQMHATIKTLFYQLTYFTSYLLCNFIFFYGFHQVLTIFLKEKFKRSGLHSKSLLLDKEFNQQPIVAKCSATIFQNFRDHCVKSNIKICYNLQLQIQCEQHLFQKRKILYSGHTLPDF